MDALVGDYPSSSDEEEEGGHTFDSGESKKRKSKPTEYERKALKVEGEPRRQSTLPPPPDFDDTGSSGLSFDTGSSGLGSRSREGASTPGGSRTSSMLPPQVAGRKPNVATEDLELMGIKRKGSRKS
uniref:Uncharacterized protein n=1 Tax=Rhodosorus marinus TaxID=101924 RepID=A0A7S0BDD8_9RHOD|mmetsp:Transcript_11388/g.16451  ORF Transcript_11388/g.16451 Transcript_11388/m.16451 type:complete len:127 (+) Transcript_11388:105-485(+)